MSVPEQNKKQMLRRKLFIIAVAALASSAVFLGLALSASKNNLSVSEEDKNALNYEVEERTAKRPLEDIGIKNLTNLSFSVEVGKVPSYVGDGGNIWAYPNQNGTIPNGTGTAVNVTYGAYSTNTSVMTVTPYTSLGATFGTCQIVIYVKADGTGLYNTGTSTAKTTSTPVSKKTLTVSSVKATSIKYGQALSASTISASVTYSGNAVSGTWAWSNPSSVLNAGTSTQKATFTPSDTNTYNTPAAQNVSVSVTAAVPDAPGTLTMASHTGDTIVLNQQTSSLTNVSARYAISSDKTNWGSWQSSPTFSGLTPATTYYFKSYFSSSNANYTSSGESTPVALATLPRIDTPSGLTADYLNNTINGVVLGGTYTVSDGTNTYSYTASGTSITCDPSFFTGGKTLKVIRKGDNTAYADSNPFTLTTEANPAGPDLSLLTISPTPTAEGKVSVSGLDATWQYSADSGSTWTDSKGTSEVLSLASSSTLQVRVKATSSSPMSQVSSKTMPTVVKISDMSVDYSSKKFTNANSNGTYTVKVDGVIVSTSFKDGDIIPDSWFGKSVTLSFKSTDSSLYTDALEGDIALGSIPSDPSISSLTYTSALVSGSKKIDVTGLTTDEEYSIDGGRTWTDVTASGKVEVDPGTNVSVRIKATSTKPCSASVSLPSPSYVDAPTGLGLDYSTGSLNGLISGREYVITADGTSYTKTASSSGEVLLDSAWYGKTISVALVSSDKTANANSVGAEVNVPSQKAGPAASSISFAQDGNRQDTVIVKGISEEEEYSLNGGASWNKGTGSDQVIPSGATVLVRYSAVTASGSEAFFSASVSLKAPTVQTQPSNVSVDYGKEKFISLDPSKTYILTVNGQSSEIVSDASGQYDISSLLGKTISLSVKGDGSTTYTSPSFEIVISPRPAQTASVIQADPDGNGKVVISGLDPTTMEYSVSLSGTYEPVTGSSMSFDPSLSVYIRIKATASQPHGEIQTLKLPNVPAAIQNEALDYIDEKITGLDSSAAYIVTVGGIQHVIVSNANGEIPFDESWYGQNISLSKKSSDLSVSTNSISVSLSVSKRLEEPTDVIFSPIEENQTQVAVSGLSSSVEYSLDKGQTWTTGDGSILQMKANSSLLVRSKATASSSCSHTVSMTSPSIYQTPSASADNEKGEISGLDANTVYTIKVGTDTFDVASDSSGKIALTDNLYGKDIYLTQKGQTLSGGTVYYSSPSQHLSILMKTPSSSLDKDSLYLTNLVPNSVYLVSGTAYTSDSSGKLAIDPSWYGTTLSLVLKGDPYDSLPQALALESKDRVISTYAEEADKDLEDSVKACLQDEDQESLKTILGQYESEIAFIKAQDLDPLTAKSRIDEVKLKARQHILFQHEKNAAIEDIETLNRECNDSKELRDKLDSAVLQIKALTFSSNSLSDIFAIHDTAVQEAKSFINGSVMPNRLTAALTDLEDRFTYTDEQKAEFAELLKEYSAKIKESKSPYEQEVLFKEAIEKINSAETGKAVSQIDLTSYPTDYDYSQGLIGEVKGSGFNAESKTQVTYATSQRGRTISKDAAKDYIADLRVTTNAASSEGPYAVSILLPASAAQKDGYYYVIDSKGQLIKAKVNQGELTFSTDELGEYTLVADYQEDHIQGATISLLAVILIEAGYALFMLGRLKRQTKEKDGQIKAKVLIWPLSFIFTTIVPGSTIAFITIEAILALGLLAVDLLLTFSSKKNK